MAVERFKTVLVKEAEDFAIKAHGSQMYGTSPYFCHLNDVVEVLYSRCPHELLTEHHIAAAWLHDTVEDTEFKISDIKREFGDKVSDIVYAVTNEVGRNRVEKTLKTLQKVRSSGRDAIIVKLADRIANTEFSYQNFLKMIEEGRHKESSHFRMYKREYPIFSWSLRNGSHGLHYMWRHLEEISSQGK